MAPLEEFETNLKEVVNARRLSASKMTQLTDFAMKSMEHDTQLVSILYRTHKSLATTTSKISSLYIFDALARAAKHHSSKHGVTGDIYTQPGNSATFLLKVGGVVEGLFQDMVASGNSESKEKTKKILDIWEKGNTFPPTILSRLSDILKGTEKALEPNSTVATDPRANTSTMSMPSHSGGIPPNAPSHSSPTPRVPVLDAQATLLALLTQAAAGTTTVPQIAAHTMGAPTSQLDAAHQLAVIQQLAHTAASVPSVSQSLRPAEPVNVQKFPSSSGVNGSSRSPPSFRDEPHKMARSDQRYSGYRSPETDTRSNPHVDEHDNMRGRYRGGFRSGGRGDRVGRNWDDRDRDRYRDSERNASPPRTGRGGRSRSRSPPSRYGDRRGPRFPSPPRRPPAASPQPRQRATSPTRPLEHGKDEFGRDIRPDSPKSLPPNENSPPPAPFPNSPVQPTHPVDPRVSSSVVAATHDSKTDHNSVSPLIPANTSSDSPGAVAEVEPASTEPGMGSFNLGSFDYTSPASWEALGKMWQVTHGFLPSTEQLMQFVVALGTGQQMNTSMESELSNQGWDQQIYAPSNRGRGRGRGGIFRGSGRGGTPYGNARNLQEGFGENGSSAHATDAIVLGGGDEEDLGHYPASIHKGGSGSFETQQSQGTSGTGRMQKVGDKWVFVRAPMDVSS